MEQESLAHCDLSGPNVLLPGLSPEAHNGLVALVDVEQLYGPDLRRPDVLPGGSAGYAHKTAPEGLWSAHADRFAGAVLLAEMLGWYDVHVRDAAEADSEAFFDSQELQQDRPRFRTLCATLRHAWGEEVARLFERAWHSDMLAECPTFGEWWIALPEVAPQLLQSVIASAPKLANIHGDVDTLQVLLRLAQRFETLGQDLAAAETYREALTLLPADSALSLEIAVLLQQVESRLLEPAPLPTITASNPQPTIAPPLLASPSNLIIAKSAWQVYGWLKHRKTGLSGLFDVRELTAFAFSPDGKQLICALNDRKMYLWDIMEWEDGDVAQIFDIDTSNSIVAVAWSKADSHAIRYLTLANYWLELRSLETSMPPVVINAEETVRDVQIPPSGQTIVLLASESVFIYQCDGVLLHKLPISDRVFRIAISPDGTLLAVETTDAVDIWRTKEGTLKTTLSTNEQVITALAFSPDGQILAIGDQTGEIALWDVTTSVKRLSLSGHEAKILSLAFSTKDALLASACQEARLRLWRTTDGMMLDDFEQEKPYTQGLAFSPDGQWLASVSRNGDIALWSRSIDKDLSDL